MARQGSLAVIQTEYSRMSALTDTGRSDRRNLPDF